LALRWWWVLALGLALGVAGSVAYVKYGPVTYQSTAQVMVPPPINPAGDLLGSPGTSREAASNFLGQAGSSHMLSLVSRAVGPKLPVSEHELIEMQKEKALEVKAQSGTSFIGITASGDSPEAARLLANTYADVLVKDVNQRAAATVAARKAQLEKQIEAARQQLATAQLHQREQDIVREIREQRRQLLALQQSYQQELERQERQGTMDRLLRSQTAGQPVSTPAPDQRVQELTSTAARLGTQTLRVLGEQQKDLDASIAASAAQLQDVRAALNRAPTAELRQRELDLARELQDQRGQLLQNNLRYQQELQRQASSGEKLTAEQERQLQELSDMTLRVRSQWLQVIGEQQQDVEKNLVDLTAQLTEVRDALAKLPGNNDPSLAAAFSTAYSNQLLALTQEYSRVQMNAQTAQTQLERYGEASPPVAMVSLKKTLPMGAGAGLGLAAALVLGLDTWRRLRAASAERARPPAPAVGRSAPPRLEAAIALLNDSLDSAGDVRLAPTGRRAEGRRAADPTVLPRLSKPSQRTIGRQRWSRLSARQ
jgi:hypothetical protein